LKLINLSKAKYPNYNKNSISILEAKAKKLGITDLQHAENGGEFYIKELGYFVDVYSKEKNIVIEYQEKHHNITYWKKRDEKRKNLIMQLLGCKFIEIKELNDNGLNIETWELYNPFIRCEKEPYFKEITGEYNDPVKVF
jgi:hypothetical protein